MEFPWTTLKYRWRLTVDQAEATALHEITARCDNPAITVTRAR
ncbi:hypothetical protein AB0A77_36360 [Streptomyces varsoviensis]